MDTVTLLATPAAILALTNLAKDFGVEGRWAALLAVILGVALSVSDGLFAAYPLYGMITAGLTLGLGAAGLYDMAESIGGKRAADDFGG